MTMTLPLQIPCKNHNTQAIMYSASSVGKGPRKAHIIVGNQVKKNCLVSGYMRGEVCDNFNYKYFVQKVQEKQVHKI